MATSPFHGSVDPDTQEVHVPFNFSFADAASRTGAPASMLSGGASKLGLQRDNFSLWILSSVSPTPTWVQIGGSSLASSGTNLGSGASIFREISGNTLQFKTLLPGTGINLLADASTITIEASAGGGGEGTPSGINLGGGASVYRETTSGSMQFKTLLPGPGINFTQATSTITIEASAATGGSQRHANFTISASTGNWDSASIPIWQGPLNASAALSQIAVDVLGNTSGVSAPAITFSLKKRDWGNLGTPAGQVDILTEPQTVGSGGSLFNVFGASTIDPRSHVLFTTDSGAESGVVSYLTMTFYYTQ